MTLQEAYDLTMQKLEGLKGAGLDVVITATDSPESTKAKYRDRPDRLPCEQWRHVCIKTPNDKSFELLRLVEADLWSQNISFDTGWMKGCRDWELDWSFKVEETLP
jgi:hypothetical protein